jgi:hypothetical protein
MSWFAKRPEREPEPDPTPSQQPSPAKPGGAPVVNARLDDGPLAGRTIQAETIEGRPPKTIDVPAEDGGACRYCLAQWEQSGQSAAYTFLYRV